MGFSRQGPAQSSPRWRFVVLAVAVMLGYAGLGIGSKTAVAQRASEMQGLASLTGNVTAPTAFKAAQVYLYNTDKHVMYMVYTSAGAFKAVAMFPGQLRGHRSWTWARVAAPEGGRQGRRESGTEVHDGRHQGSPTSTRPRLIQRRPGAETAPCRPSQTCSSRTTRRSIPPGAGRQVLENLCFKCHGENTFPMRTRSASGWRLALEHMQGKNLLENEKDRFGGGMLAGATSNFQFGIQDRKDVLEYLTKNFGVDKKPRAVRTDKEWVVDEAALAKAQYIEYYVREAAPTAGQTAAPTGPADGEGASGGVAGVRIIMQVQIDSQGNRWAVDRGIPSRLVKLDPRTGEIKTWNLPDKRAGVHEVILDRKGMVWVPEFSRTEDAQG